MPIIHENSTVKVRRKSDDIDHYKVYNENGTRLAKIEFSDNAVTEEILLAILLDRFKEKHKGSETALTKHIADCLESAQVGLTKQTVTKVNKLMSGHGYAELQVDLNSGSKLYGVVVPALPEGTDLIPMNRLHSTIMYDKRNPDVFPTKNDKVYTAKIVGVKMLGDPGSRWRACALELESPAVQDRHKELKEAGFEHSFDDLLLHVSLCYGEEAAVIYPVIKGLFDDGKLPESLTLCKETWDQCKD